MTLLEAAIIGFASSVLVLTILYIVEQVKRHG